MTVMKCRVWNLLMVLMLVTVVGCSDSGPEKEPSSNEKDNSNQTSAAEPAGDSDGGKATPGGADDAVAVDPPNPGAALQPDSNAAAAEGGGAKMGKQSKITLEKLEQKSLLRKAKSYNIGI